MSIRPDSPRSTAVVQGALPTQTDTTTALEDLLDQVWRCEADWRLNDRIDLSLNLTGDRTIGRQAGEGRR